MHLFDQNEDVNYFTFRDLNKTTVAVLLAKSLEDLVDRNTPRNVLKFKLSCEFHDGEDTVSAILGILSTFVPDF